MTSKYIKHDGILRAQDKLKLHGIPQERVVYGLDIITCISKLTLASETTVCSSTCTPKNTLKPLRWPEIQLVLLIV